LWNVIFFVYNFLFNVIVKFVFNKTSPDAVNNSVFLKFLYNVNYSMSPVCILMQDKKIVSNSSLFINNRASAYPFLHEITSVFDINTSRATDVSQVNFKNLYNEYNFYMNNSNTFSVFFNDFSTKYVGNANESFLNYILVTSIIYNNFFLNLKNVGGFFEKSVYSFSLNFALLYSLVKSYSLINTTYYVNVNFINDYSYLYSAKASATVVKDLYTDASSSLVVNVGTTYNKYLSSFEKYSNFFVKSNTSLVNVFKEWSLNLSESLANKVNSTWAIKFSGSDITKYISGSSLNNFVVYYLRKSKVFNKGRYSRNRQTYRTGVYWSLYVNIIAMIGLPYWFYRFTINFGYVWWMLYIFIASFFIPKAIKYRFYNPCELFRSFVADALWLGYQFNLVVSYVSDFLSFFLGLLKKLV